MGFQKDRLDATPDRPQHDISPKGRLGPKQPLMSARGLSRGEFLSSPTLHLGQGGGAVV